MSRVWTIKNTDALFLASLSPATQDQFPQEVLSLLAAQLRTKGIQVTVPTTVKGISRALFCTTRDHELQLLMDYPLRVVESASIVRLMCIDLDRSWFRRMFSSLPRIPLADVTAIVHEVLSHHSRISNLKWVSEEGVDTAISDMKRRLSEESQ